MTDTAQPVTAAETGVAADPIAEAANAFKTNFDQPVTERQRDEHGRFASAEPAEEIEAEEESEQPIEGEAEAEAESQEQEVETDEAAEEAQPDAVDLPASWPSEHAETWKSLPLKTQALIVEREGQRDAAVNAKFQEAANVRKANEATIAEAQTSRQKFAEAADIVLSMVQPQRPPLTMLTPGSHDYNPDAYHLANAQADEAERLITAIQQQRETAIAQLRKDAETAEAEAIAEIEAKTRPALLKDVPDLADAQKQPAILNGLVQYAIAQGIPETVFTDPEIVKGVTSAQLHLTWKAQQYDKMMAAKGKVQPKAAKPSAPVVRPGVTTSRSQVEATQRKKAFDRLDREGSVEAGAAIFRNVFKGSK